MSQLNANEIAVLAICYAGHPLPVDGKGNVYQWVRNALVQLVKLELVEEGPHHVTERGDVFMDVTERGDVFMDYLTDLELPKKTWSME